MSKPKLFLLGCSLAVVLMLGIFATSADAQENIIHSFTDGLDGADPISGLLVDHSGNFYGTTTYGGTGDCTPGCGTAFEINPPIIQGGPWTKRVIYNFSFQGGVYPGKVILDKAGNLYGTAGTLVFELVRPSTPRGNWTELVLDDLGWEADNLAIDDAGNLYGTTVVGHASNFGTVFQLSPPPIPGGTWTYTLLHNFGAFEDGRDPGPGLIVDKAGNVYGETGSGGYDNRCNGNGCGTVFALKRPTAPGSTWTYHVLHHFENFPDGAFPSGGLIFDNSGNLYGTTAAGGENVNTSCGTVFKMTPPSWEETVLYTFTCGLDGLSPQGPLLLHKGILYGTTLQGGEGRCGFTSLGCGTAFQLEPPQTPAGRWTETVLYRFQGGDDGEWPLGNLAFGVGGALYGATKFGGGKEECPAIAGTTGCGTVFQIVLQ